MGNLLNEKNRELQRHKENTNLKLYRELSYMGLPIMFEESPLIEQYLEKLYQVIYQFIWRYPRVTAIRFELKYPFGYEGKTSNKHITAFLKSVKYRIDKRYKQVTDRRIYSTELGYFWVKEQAGGRYPHYHCLFLLNKDAYSGLGSYKSRTSLYGMMRESWSTALEISWEETKGLVSPSKHRYFRNSSPYHFINMNSSRAEFEIAALFLRSSYLCKLRTKVYGGRERAFGYSSIG